MSLTSCSIRPRNPFTGWSWRSRPGALYRQQSGGPEIVEATDGEALSLGSDTFIEQRSLGLDDAEVTWALLRKQRGLCAVLEDDRECEMVKAEVLQELEAIYDFQKKTASRTRASAPTGRPRRARDDAPLSRPARRRR